MEVAAKPELWQQQASTVAHDARGRHKLSEGLG